MNAKANQLHDRFRYKPWFSCVGLKDDELVVYTKRRLTIPERDQIPPTLRGTKINVIILGEIKPH